MNGHEAITKERLRIINEEGFSKERDLEFYGNNDQLLLAANCYLYIAGCQIRTKGDLKSVFESRYHPPYQWPWPKGWWKPSEDPKRNIEKAGALIASQWDVIDGQENNNVKRNKNAT